MCILVLYNFLCADHFKSSPFSTGEIECLWYVFGGGGFLCLFVMVFFFILYFFSSVEANNLK